MKIKDNRKKFDKILGEVKELKKNPYVAIGVLGEGGNGGVVDYATYNEFGTDTIPERSFMRTTMIENEKSLFKRVKNLRSKIFEGKTTTKNVLNLMGAAIKGLIQKKITSIKTPPNSPRTIAKKGSSNPLIDSGRMRASIQWQFRKK